MMVDPTLERYAMLAKEAVALRSLWRAVLVEAIRDAVGAGSQVGGSYYGEYRSLEQQRANSWIGTRDFYEVVELAGLEVSAEEVRAFIARGDALHVVAPKTRGRG